MFYAQLDWDGGGNSDGVRWNGHLMERFLRSKKIYSFIQPIMFMQRRCQKPLYASWLLIICIELAITWHDSNFKLWILKKFKNIFTMDLESCTKISGVQWWKPFLNRMLRWVIIVKKRTKLEWTRACQHVSAHVNPCQVEQSARGEVFMR
jgi:hypothetical protein